jgi:hypothetical protein
MPGAPHRVFLSHSSKDKDFVRELYRRLTRDGVSCFFDIESISGGDNWVRALERALDECEFVVFILSPDFAIPSGWKSNAPAASPALLPARFSH